MKYYIVYSIAIIFLIGYLNVFSQSKNSNKNNPFFQEWRTPFQTPPFELIDEDSYLPAFEAGIKQRAENIEKIINNKEKPTIKNTITAWEKSSEILDRVSAVFYNMLSTNSNDNLQKIAEKVSPLLTKANDDINFNEKLFQRVKYLYDNKDKMKMTPEERMVVDNYYNDFIRAGVNLDPESKEKLRKINEELSFLYLKFGQNILKETNAVGLVVEKKEDLDGLPENVINSAAEAAKLKGYDGKWVFTLQRTSWTPFLQYSNKRELREKLFKAYISRGNNNNEYDTKDILKRIVNLRIEKVKMLGYKNFAEYKLKNSMAKDPQKVINFLKELWQPALKRAQAEADEMRQIIASEGNSFELMPWDWWYYAEKVKKAKYDLDEEMLRPYFKLENVRKGVFDLSTRLYGIKFKERKDISKYYPEVEVFEVLESNGKHIGLLYVDYFPRDSKRSGAWCSSFRPQSNLDNKFVTPLVINCGNFSKPTADKPALLSFDEVETLFHEFGHALHSLFSKVTFPSGSDLRAIDFVELPSQIMENWITEPEFLKTFAIHYQTGEPIPDELVEKVKNSSKFNQGFATVEYIAAALLDMEWHTLTEPVDVDPIKFENEFFERIGKMKEIESRYQSTNFQHIFAGEGYPAGYYGYLWAEVLDSDAFQAFKEKGLFNRQLGESFRKNILEKNGSEDPMVMYVKFRGREPKIDALLEKRGLN